jgi:transcription antitermination factor NusG
VSSEFSPGDVVFVPSGPFQGVCGVVREVDAARAQLRIVVSMGDRSHGVVVDFDEVELV